MELPLIDQCTPLQTPMMHHALYSGRTVPRPSPTVLHYFPSRHTQVRQLAILEIGRISIPPTMYVIKQLSSNASGVLYA